MATATTQTELDPELSAIAATVQELSTTLNAMLKERAQMDMTIRELARKVEGLASRVRRVESAMR
jgi:hypothetical protein